MTAEETLNTVRPRMPYWWRVHLRDGRTFDIRYPGLLLVAHPLLLISEPDPDEVEDDWPAAERGHFVAPDLVDQLEPLGPTAPARSGG